MLFPVYKRFFTGPIMARNHETGEVSPHYNIRLVLIDRVPADSPIQALQLARERGCIMPIVGEGAVPPSFTDDRIPEA